MGIIGAIGVVRSIEKLKSGRSQAEMMSIADITMVSVNGSEASQNLPLYHYQKVRELYNELQKKKEKRLYSLDDYLNVTTAIIMLFDSIAPFELYCGDPAVAASIRSMKQDPSYYEMRDMFLANPELIGLTRADVHDILGIDDFADSYSDDESDEEDKMANEDDGDDKDDEDDEGTDEELDEIIGDYGYKESYIFFCDSEEFSEDFDAQLDVDIFITEDSCCQVFVDGESYMGSWEHVHDEEYKLQGFNDDNVVVIRGLSEYLVNYSGGDLTVFEDVPQVAGIRLQHVFEKD